MGRRRLICTATLAGLTCAVLVAVGFALGNSEPLYENKPFSYWLDQIPITLIGRNGGFSVRYPWIYVTKSEADANYQQDVEQSEKALKVVTQVGGQCLPMLLRRLRSKDPPLKTALVLLAEKLHLIRASWIRPADIVRGQALTAIVKLDYSAKPIFSDLSILANDEDADVKAAAKYALTRLNPAEFERLEKLQQTSPNKARQSPKMR